MPDGSQAVSIYSGGRTKQGLMAAISKILIAFPGLSKEQADLLKDRFAENNFTDERMMDAAKHVIDTYEGYGKIPNIANFIRFDKQVKIMTYRELCSAHDKGDLAFGDYEPVDMGGEKPFFAKAIDVDRYKIKRWNRIGNAID